MKEIFAFEDLDQAAPHKDFAHALFQKLVHYQLILREDFELNESPKAVIWTPEELATSIFSTTPIPAFTRKDLIYMSPIVDEWKEIFLKQLDGQDLPIIRNYYERNTESQMMEILAHELTHHTDLFMEDFDTGNWENEIWFEEGMCFYLPRKLLLDELAFDEISTIERALVTTFADKYGKHSLSEFGSKSYEGNLTSIMYDYWRSYLAVKELVDRENGDISAVFQHYHKWYNEGKKGSLLHYFNLEDYFKEDREN
ncbi:hypothetical protein ACQKKE_09440 [Desemzia incerta]|uniref:hypothetical protein n=1 Tax=Desemzia incerta TaxID=82801 RepID=UPI003CFF3609